VLRRLAIAFVLFAIIAVACVYVSRRISIDIPWYLPMLAFVITMVSVVFTAPRDPNAPPPRRRQHDTSDLPLAEDMDDPPRR
jgi:hypothetical protein